MKQRNKLLCIVAAAALCLGLAACGARASTEPAVAPYDMTEDQEELLSLLGLTDKAMVFSFQGPEEAAELTAHTYVLENGAWVENGGVSMTRDTAEGGPFQGEFALVYRENRSMELYLHHQGGGGLLFQRAGGIPRGDFGLPPGRLAGKRPCPAGGGNPRGAVCGGRGHRFAVPGAGGVLHPGRSRRVRYGTGSDAGVLLPVTRAHTKHIGTVKKDTQALRLDVLF